MLLGDLASWIPHFRTLEERLADAIEEAWPVCVAPLQRKKDALTHEDHITEHLVHALIRTKKLPGRVVYQYALLVDDAEQNVSLSSNIDFVLTIGDDEDVYLACECKRLNVTFRSGPKGLAREYVDEGLMRFITGQYANGLPFAMMLGYVMDAQSSRARSSLKQAMQLRSMDIGLQSERDLAFVDGRPLRFFTAHKCVAGHVIEVAHTLLGWPEQNRCNAP